MMVAVYPFDETFCNDELFNYSVYRDNCLYPYFYLKKWLNEKGIEIHTYDIGDISQYDKLIMLNYADYITKITEGFFKKEDRLLFIFEPPVTSPQMWSYKAFSGYTKIFGKIFTSADNLIDNMNFYKFNYPNSIPESSVLKENLDHPRNFPLIMIGSNHTSDYPGELYTLRRQLVSYFDTHLHNFHVYGDSWNCKSWQGRCKSKMRTSRDYYFALCIENYSMPGYITEKIFDAFFAGCIPIYFGAPNISYYIPADTFIDIRNFNSLEMLLEYISIMEYGTIQRYRQNALSFLQSSKFDAFGLQDFIKTVAGGIGIKSD